MKAPEFTVTRKLNPDEQEAENALRSLGKDLANTVINYFKNEENRHEFEEWYLEQHGEAYVWKTVQRA